MCLVGFALHKFLMLSSKLQNMVLVVKGVLPNLFLPAAQPAMPQADKQLFITITSQDQKMTNKLIT